MLNGTWLLVQSKAVQRMDFEDEVRSLLASSASSVSWG